MKENSKNGFIKAVTDWLSRWFGRREIDMCAGPVLENVIRYTVPVMASSILQVLFNAADAVVIGRFRGSYALGAVGAAGTITSLLVNLGVGLSLGVSVTVAHAMGAGRQDEVHKTVHTAVPIALASGVLMLLPGLFIARPLLVLLNAPAEVLDMAVVYVRIYLLGLPATLLYNYAAAVLRAAGDTRGPMVSLTAAGIANVLLNVLFVAAFGMGVEGVALATTLSQILSAVLTVRLWMKREDGCRLDWRSLTLDKTAMRRIFRIGVPSAVQGLLFNLGTMPITAAINSFGASAVSGLAAANSIHCIPYFVMNAFSQASVNFVGQNMGAHNPARIREVTRKCCLCATVSGIVTGVAAFVLARPLLKLFIKPDEPDLEAVLMYGAVALGFICLPYFLNGLMEVTAGTLRGMGKSVEPTVVTLIGVCGVRIVWVYTVLPHFRDFGVLMASYAVSWVITTAALVWLYFRELKEFNKRLADKASAEGVAKDRG